jgi:hypothetical protein
MPEDGPLLKTSMTLVTLGVFALSTAADADTLHLKNGSMVIGNLLSADTATLRSRRPLRAR